MAMLYNVVQRPEPGVPGGGEKKWYASTAFKGVSDTDDLIQDISDMSTMSSGDIQGVIYTMVDVIAKQLSRGHIVRIGKLGDLRISISSEGHLDEEEVDSGSIRRTRINFRPGPKLRNTLKLLTFERKAD